MACFSAWDIQNCGCGGAGCLTCLPCKIPNKDLTLTITSSLYGAGTAPLIFNGSSTWAGSWSFTAGLSFYTYNGILTCVSNGIQFCINSGTPADNCCNGPFGLILNAYTCNPFHLDYVITSGTITPACSTHQGTGFSHFYIDDPGSPLTTC